MVILTKISYIETLFKVWFIKDSVLFMVRFRQVILTTISYIETLFKIWFIKDSVLFRVRFRQVILTTISYIRTLICLPFERRETYCFSLIFFFRFFSAKLVRTITFLSFQIGQSFFGLWVHDHKAVFPVP